LIEYFVKVTELVMILRTFKNQIFLVTGQFRNRLNKDLNANFLFNKELEYQ